MIVIVLWPVILYTQPQSSKWSFAIVIRFYVCLLTLGPKYIHVSGENLLAFDFFHPVVISMSMI